MSEPLKEIVELTGQWLEQGDARALEQATRLLQDLMVEAPPSEAMRWKHLLAALYFQCEDDERAIPHFRELCEGAPGDDRASSDLSFVLGCAGKLEEAIEVMEGYRFILEDERSFFLGRLRDGRLDRFPHVRRAVLEILG